MTSILCIIFFISGAAALIFEMLWFQLAGLTFGNSVWASSIVLASFMGGLALGNGLSARWGHRIKEPLKFYALLEAGISITGFLLVLFLPKLTYLLSPLFKILSYNPILINGFRLLMSFFLMLIPATAMGATLPVLVKSLYAFDRNFGKILGTLYGWNTLGAVVGVILSESFLIRFIGISGTGIIAACFNVLAAILALAINKKYPILLISTIPEPAFLKSVPVRKITNLLLVSFLCGFTLLALEVIWFRFILLFFISTIWTFTAMLSVVLLGISTGGLTASCIFRIYPDAQKSLIYLLCGNGVAITVLYANFGTIFELVQRQSFLTQMIISSLTLMFPVCFLSGLIYTLLGKLFFIKLADEIKSTGVLTLTNTIGGMFGSFAGGIIFLPIFGVENSFFILTLFYGVAAGAILLMENRTWLRNTRWKIILAFSVYVIALFLFPFHFMSYRYLDLMLPKSIVMAEKRVAYNEGVMETIQYLQKDILQKPYFYRLVSNHDSLSNTNYRGKRYMKFFVYLPVALNPSMEDGLLICYGCGNTAKALTDTKTFKHLDFVDISKGVFDLSYVVYPDPQQNPLNDPRVHTYVEDGRFFLLTTPKKYDLITAEPPPPKHSGIVNLYTQEYFQLIYERLKPGGIVTYWLPVYQLKTKETKAILKAFSNVFETNSLWTGADLEWMMVGIKKPFQKPPLDAFAQQWQDIEVKEEMQALGFISPGQLGAFFITDSQGIRDWVAETPPLKDNFPQRLSPPSSDQAYDSVPYYRFMDSSKCRSNFLQSRFIADVWPEPLIKEAEHHFAFRPTIDLLLSAHMPWITELNSCIQNDSLTPYVLWVYLSDQTVQNIISETLQINQLEQTLQNEKNVTELLRHFAARATQQKDYESAEKYLNLATDHLAPQSRSNDFYYSFRAYLLYIMGKKSQAQMVLSEYINRAPLMKQEREKYAKSVWQFLSTLTSSGNSKPLPKTLP